MWPSNLDHGLLQETWTLGSTSNVLNDITAADNSVLPLSERNETPSLLRNVSCLVRSTRATDRSALNKLPRRELLHKKSGSCRTPPRSFLLSCGLPGVPHHGDRSEGNIYLPAAQFSPHTAPTAEGSRPRPTMIKDYRLNARTSTPPATMMMPAHSRVVGRSPRNAHAKTATRTRLNLSTGATFDASPA